jgi:hypothetical protein
MEQSQPVSTIGKKGGPLKSGAVSDALESIMRGGIIIDSRDSISC